MIFVTGDTHGTLDADKFSQRHFPVRDELTRQDYDNVNFSYSEFSHGA